MMTPLSGGGEAAKEQELDKARIMAELAEMKKMDADNALKMKQQFFFF